ncbi:MAG: hypothetical protein K2O18_15270 [Oscillospiraceae bacterium]|nr:hypothetical protein [Oscillospiraceae bacterium]
MKILYGTTNQAKLESMRRVTEPLSIELLSPQDLDLPLPEIEETGKNPLENAVIKAKAYYRTFSMPVFSCDSGLYFEDLKESLQPGTHIRRVNGAELTDEEMIAYYSSLAKTHGGSLTGRYRNAICLVVNDTLCFSSMDESLSSEPFLLASEAHPKREKGFPLDSLSVEISSGRYYYDIQERSLSQSAQGFRAFFEKVLAELIK